MPDFKITPLGAGQVRIFVPREGFEAILPFTFFLLSVSHLAFATRRLIVFVIYVSGCRQKLYFVVHGWQKYNARLWHAHGL